MTGNAGSTLEALLLWWTTSCTVWLCGVLNSGAAMLSAAVVIYHVQGCSQQAVPVRLAGCVTENVSGMQHQGLLGSGHDHRWWAAVWQLSSSKPHEPVRAARTDE
jgi:hypothetical protein